MVLLTWALVLLTVVLVALTVVLVVLTLVMLTVGRLSEEEARARLERLPGAIIGLAARRLPEAARADRKSEWDAELQGILAGNKDYPVTRLFEATRFALGLLCRAGAIGLTDAPKARPWLSLASSLGVPRFRDPQAEELVTALRAGRVEARMVAEHAMAMVEAEAASVGGRRLDRLAPLRAAAVDGLSAAQVTELVLSMWDACLYAQGRRLLWAWLQPERICKRQPGDVAVIKRLLSEHCPDKWTQTAPFVRDAIDNWSLDHKQAVERMLRHGQEPPPSAAS